jgi:integrase/recombinase XerD
MQHDITIYQEPITIELVLESGQRLSVEMPGQAEQDSAFLQMWLHGKSEKTQTAYIADMRKFYSFCGLSLQYVKLEDFQRFIDSLASLKPSSQARTIAAVKSALSFGMKTGYLTFNVGAVVKLPKIENTLAERIMSEQQTARMFALENNTRNHAILVLLYRAALRAEELCNLTWAKLQQRDDAGQIAVFGKGKDTRFVLIDEATWDEVMQLHTPDSKPDDYVFHSRQEKSRLNESRDRGRLDESMIHRIVRDAANRAGVAPGKVSPHWMRHAHATHSLENGAPITLVQNTLGHKDIKTTAKYTHVRPNASSGQFLKV